MSIRRHLAPTLLALAGLAAVALPAAAATARASDPINIFAMPRTYAKVIGRLDAGQEVRLDRCTPDGAWCKVVYDGPTGWVPGSYLTGAWAKIEATPGRSLTAPPLDQDADFHHFHHQRN